MSCENEACVTIIGGGMAGMAVSIHLAKAGFRVSCIEPEESGRQTVGESLDWSAPGLLAALGLAMDQLVKDEIATYKKHVTLKLGNGSSYTYIPGAWLGRRPFKAELRTMHVDRFRLDAALREIAIAHGVQITKDRVVEIEKEGQRITGITTNLGKRFESPWYVDASGSSANLFPKTFHLPMYRYGPRKVAMWGYFVVPDSVEGTTIYSDGSDQPYMEWVWEIPIRNTLISVGYVSSGDDIKKKRQEGLSVEDIFKARLSTFPRFEPLLCKESVPTLCVTSFQCRVFDGVTGPNWIVIGEAASMVDPMTSNGVTAALRHAAEAANLINRSRHRKNLMTGAAARYNRRNVCLGRFFNDGIEKVIYDKPIRSRLGLLTAGDAYTIPAWVLNYLYSRFKPAGMMGTSIFQFLMFLSRASAAIYHSYCQRLKNSWRVAS